MHLLRVIFPIVHVACAVGEDYTVSAQRSADDHCRPKRGHWLEKGSRRCGFSYCGRCVGLAFHINVWIVDVRVVSARTLFNGCYWRTNSLELLEQTANADAVSPKRATASGRLRLSAIDQN